jgi:hypothetical protein
MVAGLQLLQQRKLLFSGILRLGGEAVQRSAGYERAVGEHRQEAWHAQAEGGTQYAELVLDRTLPAVRLPHRDPGKDAMSNMSEIDAFCQQVDELVEERYGYSDGGDMCYNLIETGQLFFHEGLDPEGVAEQVARLLEQQ